jgi:hypothetical protein
MRSGRFGLLERGRGKLKSEKEGHHHNHQSSDGERERETWIIDPFSFLFTAVSFFFFLAISAFYFSCLESEDDALNLRLDCILYPFWFF